MVAFKRWGYHASGTMIVRPSARSTASVSSVTCTSRTRSPELRGEAFTPFLRQEIAILCHEPVDSPQLHRTEAKVSGQRNRVQPELRRPIVTTHMDVGRLIRLMAVKLHAVRPHQQYGLNVFQHLTVVRRIPAALLSIRRGARPSAPEQSKSHFPLPLATSRK
jgi:hypothetical protein